MYFIFFLAIISGINEPFEVWYSGFTIHFRGIDVGIAGPVTANRVKFGIYAGQVVTDVQIYWAGEKPEIGEVVRVRSGTEEKFPSERGTNTIRIPKAAIVGFLSNRESVRDFETCIGY